LDEAHQKKKHIYNPKIYCPEFSQIKLIVEGTNMRLNEIFTAKRMVFLVIFGVAALAAMNVNYSALVGAENQYFTLFQFFGPTAGAFLGGLYGIIAVLFAQFANYLISGKEFTLVNMLRLLPMLFAIFYFALYARKNKVGSIMMIAIPSIAILLFVMHPVAGHAWYFALYWLIPILGVVLPKKIPGKLFFRSFGATFTAHAVGGIVWLYTVPMTAEQWTMLIPVVAAERFMFGIGIAVSYVLFNTLLDFISEKMRVPSNTLQIEKEYVLTRRFRHTM